MQRAGRIHISLDAIRGLCDDPDVVTTPVSAVIALRQPLFSLLLSLTLFGGQLSSAAAATAELFAAEVAVPDTNEASRGAGVVAALAAVLTKVTGRRDPESFAAWPRLREAADRLLLEYRYRVEEPVASAEDPLSPATTVLHVRFDRQGLESLLREARLPIWGDTRPATLVLLAVEHGAERFVYTPDAMPQAARALAEAGKRRGIPLVEPLMDLEDRSMLRFSEIWGGFPEVIERIEARYDIDAVLVGRLFSESEQAWRAQWTLHLAGARDTWQSQGTLTATLNGGVAGLADRLAQRYVPDPVAGEQRVAIAVSGIRAPADYARVMGFLRGLASVSAVRPRLATRERLELELETDVAPDALLRTLGLGTTLEPTTVTGDVRDAVPSYRLRQ